MTATTSSNNTASADTPHDTTRAAHRDHWRGERGPRGCGWHFGGHFGHRFGDRFGARLAERFGGGGRAGWHQPPVDIEDTADAFVLSLFATQLDKRGIRVEVLDDVLTIRYQTPQSADDSGRRFTRRESRSPDFIREFGLNGKVCADAIEASYTEGVLTVRLPKTPQAMQPQHTIVVS